MKRIAMLTLTLICLLALGCEAPNRAQMSSIPAKS